MLKTPVGRVMVLAASGLPTMYVLVLFVVETYRRKWCARDLFPKCQLVVP